MFPISSSPALPISSDPALLDDWIYSAQSPAVPLSSTYSDVLEAIRLVNDESIARKNRDGQVIQHRAWKLRDAFRSDDDHNLEGSDTPSRKRSSTRHIPFPSSPPVLNMPSLISSPVAYPQSSSPPANKRPAPVALPRKTRAIGGFLEDDSDDENFPGVSERPSKRRMLNGQKSPSPLAPRPFDSSENPMPNARLQHPAPTRIIGGFLVEDDEDDLEGLDSQMTGASSKGPSISLPDPKLDTSSRPSFLFSHFLDRRELRTCAGKCINIRPRQKSKPATFEELVAARSVTKAGKAKKSYYGIDIHRLIDDAVKETGQEESRKSNRAEEPLPSVEYVPIKKSRRTMMWTEKYRARRFLDLVGDDRTNREVLRWLKGWDPVVFPRSGKPKPTFANRPNAEGGTEEKQHRKILLLTGAPGLGKTTLAHVCARQAGYEVMEINASDERSSNVVKGRIRTTVGTESVKTVGTTMKDGRPQKLARPVCVIVDEVDGVVSGSSGSGEGGFIKALIDLIQLDAKNDNGIANGASNGPRRKVKGDNFRLLRPLILVCNDVYHPSLRPLRQSSFAEVIHMRKPPLEAVVTRMKSVFGKEGVDCDGEGVRKLCEATWGMSSGPEARLDSSGTGEGDLRSLLVVGEWAAGKIRSSADAKPKLTREWVEQNMLSNLSHGGGGARGVGRGGVKEVVSRVFLTGAGFPKSEMQLPVDMAINSDPTIPRAKLHASEISKKAGMDRLREMVDTGGDIDRIVTDIFSVYPSQPFNDDSILSKPDSAYEWLHFHDACSSRVYSDQDWELMPYLGQPILACHDLFASPAKHYSLPADQKKWNNGDVEGESEKEIPFSGPRADYDAKEAEKAHRATIQELQSSMSATQLRSFRSAEEIATDLLPHLVRMLSPDVKPIIVGGSGEQRGIASVRKEGEKAMINRAVNVMCGFQVKFERGKLEGDFTSRTTQWVYRMEPPLDTLTDFPTASALTLTVPPTRYAVRQVLDQEHQKQLLARTHSARQARFQAGSLDDDNSAPLHSHPHPHAPLPPTLLKKDFFGRTLPEDPFTCRGSGKNKSLPGGPRGKDDNQVWVSFHEGFSNAVRKPVSVADILRGL